MIIIVSEQCAQVRSLGKFAQSLISPDKYPHMQRPFEFSPKQRWRLGGQSAPARLSDGGG